MNLNHPTLGFVAWILVIVGAINWLLVGLVNLNLVAMLFGASIIARLIYILVGLGGCYLLYMKYGKKNTGVA